MFCSTDGTDMGQDRLMLRAQDAERAIGDLKRQIAKIQRLKGKVIVVSEGVLVTGYHQSNPQRVKTKGRIKTALSRSDTANPGILLRSAFPGLQNSPVARIADSGFCTRIETNFPCHTTRHASYGPSPRAFRRRIRPNSPPFPTSGPENPAPRGPRRGCRSWWSAGWCGRPGARDHRQRL